jgi:OOP family OmpA-OmpF porin
MKRVTFPALLVLGLAFVASAAVTRAGEVPQLGANATSDQMIPLLTPKSGAATPPFRMRGLKLLTANPAAGKDGPAPAVGLDIKFKVNSAQLSETSQETLKQLAIAMKSEQLAKYHFLIEGHTDSTGRPDRNLKLSNLRADSVRDYLVSSSGISRSRLVTAGRGQTQPLDPADPANPANRRVQVVNVGERLVDDER